MAGLKIVTDFSDYYDSLSDSNAKIVYNRKYSECNQRGTALNILRKHAGIKTIDLKPVSDFLYSGTRIVVYTNPKLHNGEGKRIMTVEEAMQSYSNYIASRYYEECDSFVKFLQVGSRRFTINYKRNNKESLTDNSVIDISEATSGYNKLLGLPIYSIDYIAVDNAMIATDFNEVECLKHCGIERFMTAEQVVEEIQKSLIAYNKG